MCGVIGLVTKNINNDLEILKELFIQTQIRGKHATGISYVEDYEIKTVSESIPACKFVKELEIRSSVTHIIGHCRYSTSSLEYNQPITIGNSSIVHNGVVTQIDPELWKDKFKYKCSTKNDSELLLADSIEGNENLVSFPTASISSIELFISEDGHNVITFARNSMRPLWHCYHNRSLWIASTSDILKRTFNKFGIDIYPIKCKPFIRYTHIGCKLIEQPIKCEIDLIYTPELSEKFKSLV